MKIGFIGLGIMGAPMALHLVDAGHQLFVKHAAARCPDSVAASSAIAVRRRGAKSTRQAEVVFLMLPDTPDVESVLFGAGGVASALCRPGGARKIIVDMSSISPMATKAFAQKINAARRRLHRRAGLRRRGRRQGGVADDHVRRRPRRCSRRVRPLLEKMGKNITLVGGNGDGQTTKVANQIIVALNIAAVGEALLFASKAGADPAKVRQALMGGFASSRILEVHGERMIKRTFNPGFRIRLHQKDLGLALHGARELGVVAAADGERGAADAGLRRATAWPTSTTRRWSRRSS